MYTQNQISVDSRSKVNSYSNSINIEENESILDEEFLYEIDLEPLEKTNVIKTLNNSNTCLFNNNYFQLTLYPRLNLENQYEDTFFKEHRVSLVEKHKKYFDYIYKIFRELIEHKSLFSDSSVNIISNLYIYRNFYKITEYLTKNPQIEELLLETYFKLREYFGNETQINLELTTDIYEPEEEQLFIRIPVENTIDKLIEKLDNFEKDWWFERTGFIIDSPIVTLE